ncbi:hypothetical protein DNK77_28875 [Enterobacter cloacae complex sp.]|nr:hypothetical protein DNK77_28875 [Enterobacter cloacae complex sp.]RAY67510.1 hypothetical protein DP199_20180 [Enterobacter kobei]
MLYVTSSCRLTCRFAASGGRLRAARLPQPRTPAHITGFAGRSGGITLSENPVNLSAGMCLMAHAGSPNYLACHECIFTVKTLYNIQLKT